MREIEIMMQMLTLLNLNANISLFKKEDNAIVIDEFCKNYVVYETKDGAEYNKTIYAEIKDACSEALSRINKSLAENYDALVKAVN
jgi:hypothetical protein